MIIMKKQYQEPKMTVVNVTIENHLCVDSVQGNGGISLSKTGGSGPARGREDSWDDEY